MTATTVSAVPAVPAVTLDEPTGTADQPTAAVSRTATVIASVLWVFVGGLLAYGIAQTAIKAAALFG